jgi:serine/threonine protein kinase
MSVVIPWYPYKLSSYLKNTDNSFNEEYVVVICKKLVEILEGVHAKGIIHRNVCAANVLIADDIYLNLCLTGFKHAIYGSEET